MFSLVILAIAFLIDIFFSHGLFEYSSLYTGFLIAVLFSHTGTMRFIWVGTVLYGILLDILNPEIFFGVMLAAHILSVAIAGSLYNEYILNTYSKRAIGAMFAAVLGYGLFMESIKYLFSALFSNTAFGLTGQFLWTVFIGSAVTVLIVWIFIGMISLFKANTNKWFLPENSKH